MSVFEDLDDALDEALASGYKDSEPEDGDDKET